MLWGVRACFRTRIAFESTMFLLGSSVRIRCEYIKDGSRILRMKRLDVTTMQPERKRRRIRPTMFLWADKQALAPGLEVGPQVDKAIGVPASPWTHGFLLSLNRKCKAALDSRMGRLGN